MEFAIPILQFDPDNVTWGQSRTGPFRRTISFGYEDSAVTMTNLILTLHPLKVIEIDNERNQITLEESKGINYLSRLEQFQTNVSSELEKNPTQCIEQSKLPSVIRNPLQIWIKSKRLTLYLSPEPESLNFYTEDGPTIFSHVSVKPGDMIRATIKIQGLSLQMTEDDIWTGKSRIQHHILQLYKVSSC